MKKINKRNEDGSEIVMTVNEKTGAIFFICYEKDGSWSGSEETHLSRLSPEEKAIVEKELNK